MYKIMVTLPSNRDFAGQLSLQDGEGRMMLGPFPVAGRADDLTAAKYNNPARNPLLPYGDTPTGQYRVAQAILPGQDVALDVSAYGSHGVLVLEPMDGEAALADAHGRFRLLIQGGDADPDGQLRATSGSLRLIDRDQRVLMQTVQQLDRVICECVESQHAHLTRLIARSAHGEVNDPPLTVNLGGQAVTPVHGLGQMASISPTVSIFVPMTVVGGGAGMGMLAMAGGGGAYDPGSGGSGGQDDIDFNFIGTLEGGQQTEGYVPDADQSKSGVTVATGVDIGQMNAEDIQNLDIPDALKEKLTPYAGLTGTDAENYLEEHPLNLTSDEANALDHAVQQDAVDQVTSSYNAATTGTDFAQLPPEAQTVIASVAFQYGNLATRTPNFWHDVTTQNWEAAINELRNFGDNYSTRHNQEANLLQQMLDSQQHTPLP